MEEDTHGRRRKHSQINPIKPRQNTVLFVGVYSVLNLDRHVKEVRKHRLQAETTIQGMKRRIYPSIWAICLFVVPRCSYKHSFKAVLRGLFQMYIDVLIKQQMYVSGETRVAIVGCHVYSFTAYTRLFVTFSDVYKLFLLYRCISPLNIKTLKNKL